MKKIYQIRNPTTFRTLALILSTFLAGCHRGNEREDTPQAKVEQETITFAADSPQAASFATQPAQPRKEAVLRLNGRLVWDEDATVHIFTPFAGRVARIVAQAGQSVEKDAPLAIISSPEYGQAQGEAAKAALDLNLADKTLNRLRELSEHGAAPLKELQVAEVEFSRAQGEARRTVGRLALYGGATNSLDQEFVLKTPLAGVVVEKNINPGQQVSLEQMTANAPPLFVVTEPSGLWVLLDATEQDLPSLKPGSAVTLRTQTYPDKTFGGRIETISDFVDPNSRTIKVRGKVNNEKRLLKAEMFVNAELPTSPQVGVDVPSSAVFLKGERHYVFVEETRGAYQRREVKIGSEHDGKTLVTEGLEAGRRVVTDGALLLDQLINEGGA